MAAKMMTVDSNILPHFHSPLKPEEEMEDRGRTEKRKKENGRDRRPEGKRMMGGAAGEEKQWSGVLFLRQQFQKCLRTPRW